MTEPRRTFGPVVLLGLASALLAAIAGTNAWVAGDQALQIPDAALADTLGESPLGAALGLVLLACWGVVLVTRRLFRRAVAWLGVAAALGYAVTVAAAPVTLTDRVADQLAEATATDSVAVSLTGWWWVAVAAAVVVVVTSIAGALLVKAWPEMGARYDAPADSGPAPDAPLESNLDIWKALDEGRDPTA